MALNVKKTKAYFEQNNVVALKADKNPEVDALLRKLGNTAEAIPYYAIYPADGGAPIHFGGNYLTSSEVIKQVEKARSGKDGDGDLAPDDVSNVSMLESDTESPAQR